MSSANNELAVYCRDWPDEAAEIIHELASALRAFTTAYPTHPAVFSPSTVWLDEAQELGVIALARVDALGGHDE